MVFKVVTKLWTLLILQVVVILLVQLFFVVRVNSSGFSGVVKEL